jgi:hypothetical protein
MSVLLDFSDFAQDGMSILRATKAPRSSRISPMQYSLYLTQAGVKANLAITFDALRERLPSDMQQEFLPVLLAVRAVSAVLLPAYGGFLPSAVSADWLSLVDWLSGTSRDHILHQPLTAYIALKLTAELKLSGDETLSSLCGRLLASGLEANWLREAAEQLLRWRGSFRELYSGGAGSDFYWQWILRAALLKAALFHDIGYPHQQAQRLIKRISDAGDWMDFSRPTSEQLFRSCESRLLAAPYECYGNDRACRSGVFEEGRIRLFDKALRRNHGLPGAIAFLRLNDCLLKWPATDGLDLSDLTAEWASLGIMLHDMHRDYWGDAGSSEPVNPYLRVTLSRDPLSCILALADHLQEFGRFEARFSPMSTGKGVRLSYNKNCDSVSVSYNPSTRTLLEEYSYSSSTARIKAERRFADEHWQLFSQPNGFIDLSAAGIEMVEARFSVRA